MWFTQHIVSHHPFTNIIGYDPDLGRPDSHEQIKFVQVNLFVLSVN